MVDPLEFMKSDIILTCYRVSPKGKYKTNPGRIIKIHVLLKDK